MAVKKIVPGPNTVKGIDVSHWQPKVDFAQVKKAGFEFAFLKATEGTGVKDSSWALHSKNARANGVLVGGYHFFHQELDGVKQAEHFVKTMGEVDHAEDLPPVLDFEWQKTPVYRSATPEGVARALAFLKRVKELTGETPIIYTAASFFNGAPRAAEFAPYPLWVAHYTTGGANVCPPWANWLFWQHSDKGAVPGAGNIDVNVFNGTLAQLKSLAAVGRVGTPPSTPVGIDLNEAAVKLLQAGVNATGYVPMLKEDGDAGPLTRAGLIAVVGAIPPKA